MRTRSFSLCILFLLACDEKKAPKQIEPWQKDPGQSAAMGGRPMGGAAAGDVVEGKVLETMDAATYTYMRLQTANGETWAAIPKTTITVGSTQKVVNASVMDGFESATLKRKFDRIVFGTLGSADPAAPAKAAPASTPPAAAVPASPLAATPPAQIKVSKATGADAKTVAEVWAEKAALKGKTVVVHGQVVKATRGVLQKNWYHLRDGSGSEAKLDNDITVTTQADAAVGDVITIKGTVALDRDFGAGYTYGALIEEATIQK